MRSVGTVAAREKRGTRTARTQKMGFYRKNVGYRLGKRGQYFCNRETNKNKNDVVVTSRILRTYHVLYIAHGTTTTTVDPRAYPEQSPRFSRHGNVEKSIVQSES